MSDSKFQLERVQGAPVSNEEILTDIRHAAKVPFLDGRVNAIRIVCERPGRNSAKSGRTLPPATKPVGTHLSVPVFAS